MGSIVSSLVVANYLFLENDPYLKSDQRKQDNSPSAK